VITYQGLIFFYLLSILVYIEYLPVEQTSGIEPTVHPESHSSVGHFPVVLLQDTPARQ
jgi:hypothetical protein